MIDFMSSPSEKSSLKVTHIIEEYSASAGGVPAVVAQITRRTAALGVDVEIVCVRENPLPAPAGVCLRKIELAGFGTAWGWSRELGSILKQTLADSELRVAHLHGVWMAPQWMGAKIARQLNVPIVLTDHGMLDRWLWNYKGKLHYWKKKLYWNYVAYPVFRHASVIHAITAREREFLAKLFPKQRIEVIPNAVDLSEIDNISDYIGEGEDGSGDRIILFIGRLDPQKGIDILIRAFARAALSSDWKLVITGPERIPGYLGVLKKLVAQEGVVGRVAFLGEVSGVEKWRLYRQAWVVAVPSHFEAVGMVNLEAAACRTPTITTFETGLTDWEEGGGLLISPKVKMLIASLREVCTWSDKERKDRGTASRNLVERKYSWDLVVRQWLELYKSLVV